MKEPAESVPISALKLMLHPSSNSKILIIGARSTNFPGEFRDDHRIIFWDSTDPSTRNKTKIPEDVRVIIFTRFVSHSSIQKIKKITPSNVRLMNYVQGTGEIKAMLRTIDTGGEGNPRVEEKSGETQKRGQVREFLLTNADFKARNAVAEIRRLFRKAMGVGLKTTERSVEQAFYALRKKARERQNEATGAEDSIVPATSIEPPPLVEIPQPEIGPRREPSPTTSNLDQSIEILKAFVGQLQLASLALEELLADYDRLKNTESEVHHLREMLASLLARLDSK